MHPITILHVEHLHLHFPHGGDVLAAITDLKGTLMATQSEHAQALTDLAAQTEKAKAEVVAKVQALEDALANAGNTTPEVDAAMVALKGAIQGVDDLNQDPA